MMGSVRELYFAYGSNLSSQRLALRIPDPEAAGVARLDDHRLLFNKPSRDGSGKANLVPAPGEAAWGVLWSISVDAWPILDRFEPGYLRRDCQVHDRSGRPHSAQVYLWQEATPEQRPFAGYLAHVLAGAREHGLPAESIGYLAGTTTRPDPEEGKA